MLTIRRVVEEGLCVFCNKPREVVAITMDGQGTGELLLCWPDLKRVAQMRMRMGWEDKTPRPAPALAATPPAGK